MCTCIRRKNFTCRFWKRRFHIICHCSKLRAYAPLRCTLGPTFRIDGFGKYGLTEVVLLIRHLLALNLQSVRSSGWSRMMLSNFHHYQQLYRNWLIKPAGSTVTSPVLTNLQTEFKYRLLKMLSLNICQHFSVYHKQFFV